jgi:membrane protein DedA with SNARE-associated domain
MDNSTFIGFVIRALIWGFTYYFIRRGLNPANTELEKFQADAIYGSLATFVGALMFWYVDKNIISRI